MAIETIKPNNPSQKPIVFHKGGLHASTHTPMGQKIPESKRAAALAGKFGSKAKAQALFAKNVLHH
jgi:hypothetical protein